MHLHVDPKLKVRVAQSVIYRPVPVDVITEPAASHQVALTVSVLSLVAAVIPFLGAILMAMGDLSGGVA